MNRLSLLCIQASTPPPSLAMELTQLSCVENFRGNVIYNQKHLLSAPMGTTHNRLRKAQVRYKRYFHAHRRLSNDKLSPGDFLLNEAGLVDQPHKLALIATGSIPVTAQDPRPHCLSIRKFIGKYFSYLNLGSVIPASNRWLWYTTTL